MCDISKHIIGVSHRNLKPSYAGCRSAWLAAELLLDWAADIPID